MIDDSIYPSVFKHLQAHADLEGHPEKCHRLYSRDEWPRAVWLTGLREGEEISPADAFMLVPIVAGAFSSTPDIKALVTQSIENRAARKDAYKL